MRIQSTRLRAFFCVTAFVLCLQVLPPVFGSETARPITSLTPDERTKLPDTTQVTLKSGKTVTLGTLRSEHRARMERFAKASGLGRAAAGKLLPPRPATPMQVNPAVTGKPGTTGTAGKPVVGTGKAGGPRIGPSLVTFNIPVMFGHTPKDYLDFCNAANPSVCIYLPANTSFALDGKDPNNTWVMDVDYLIGDKSICDYDGGVYQSWDLPPSPTVPCVFYYPVVQQTNFLPSGPLTTAIACDPPSTNIVDPKGAIKISYPYSGSGVTIGPAPATCVVQVWIGTK